MAMQKDMMGRAVRDSFAKLDPRVQIQNPVMFLVWLSAVMTSVLAVASVFGVQDAGVPTYYVVAIAVILWLTDLFSNFAEALAEGRGKAQADSLRAAKKDVEAHRIESVEDKEHFTVVPGTELTRGDLVIVRAGEQIPGDGDVIEGAASVDESAITGESAPVVREAGGDRSAVTGGTTVLSDWIIVKISSEPGQSFLDKMIAMVEGAARKKTPNEIALEIFLVALSIVFILVTLALYCYSCFSAGLNDMANPTSVTTLVALLVCLAPTTIGALLSAIGIAGMSRLNEANVLAMSGRAIEAAGDVDILMLDKTGTITLGNRQASEFIPVDGVDPAELADAAQLSSLADETPEGRSIVVLAKEQFGLRGRTLEDKGMEFIPFTAATRMSGVNYEGNEIRKGAADSVRAYVEAAGGVFSQECDEVVERIAKAGGTPLVVTKNCRVLGVVYLKDIIKSGVKEKFADLRKMGIKTIMVTGDGCHRGRGGRGRLPGRGHPRGQAREDPRVPARGPSGRHDRRRHQRRARSGPGRRGRGHEHGHPGCQGGRQHGRPRLQPHQAHRYRAYRQAAAHDPRFAHDLLGGQRRGEVLRHHPRPVLADLPGPWRAQHPRSGKPAVRGSFGHHLQRARYRRADPGRAEGR